MRVHGSTHSAILSTLLVATTLTACTSWRVQPVGPEQLLNDERPDAVRIQRADSSRVVLNSPELVPDSLQGMAGGHRTSVPLADITQIEARRGNGLKTVGLILGIIVVTPLLYLAAVCTGGCFTSD